ALRSAAELTTIEDAVPRRRGQARRPGGVVYPPCAPAVPAVVGSGRSRVSARGRGASPTSTTTEKGAAMARRLTARPSPAWVGALPVFERTLANGFKALVLPRTHAPVVVCDLYYPVGSVDEPAGKTGLAHFVEHMLFKGTERFPKGQIDRLAFVAAGQSNAETGEDCTHYWFAFPSDRWELALAIEADRMRGATFDPREV